MPRVAAAPKAVKPVSLPDISFCPWEQPRHWEDEHPTYPWPLSVTTYFSKMAFPPEVIFLTHELVFIPHPCYWLSIGIFLFATGSGPSHHLSASCSTLWSLAQQTHVMVDGICQSQESSGIQHQTHGLLILGTDSSFLSLPFLVSKLYVSMSPVCSSVSPHGSTLPHCPGHPTPGSW